jgi:hypothetical protein
MRNFSDWLQRHGVGADSLSPLALNTVSLSTEVPADGLPHGAHGRGLLRELDAAAQLCLWAPLPGCLEAGGETRDHPLYLVLKQRGVRFEFSTSPGHWS